MPNWVKNIIHIAGPADHISKALDLVRDKNNDIDFNNIIPMPQRLNIVAGSNDRYFVALYLKSLSETDRHHLRTKLETCPLGYYGNYLKKYEESFTMSIPDETRKRLEERLSDYNSVSPTSIEDVGRAYIDNILEYGADTWYEWCIEHWGTKWNACECTIGDDYLEFETAWSAPHPVIETLSEKFPSLVFYHEWADEDLGSNCGKCELRNGNVVANYRFESGDEAYEFACTMWGYGPDEFEDE